MNNLLTAKEAAEFLNCHPQTVYRNEGLPSIDIPGIGKRYNPDDLKEYIEKNKYKYISKLPQVTDNHRIILTSTPDYGIRRSNESGGSEMAKAKTKSRFNFGNGAIYTRKTKKGKIRWYLDYKDSEGNRIQRVAASASTKEEAVYALNEATSKVFDEKHNIQRRKRKIGFTEFSQIYLKDYAMVVKKSWKTDQSRMTLLIDNFNNTELRKINQSAIRKFIALREKAGNTQSTINRYMALLRKMFNYAIEEGYLEKNPMDQIKSFSEKDNLKERILTEDEEARLMKESSPHLKSIIVIALNTGMRLGKILNLRWDQIDMDNQTIKVDNTKNGRSRTIPVNDTLYKEIDKLKTQKNNKPFIFFNEETGKPLTTVKTAFKAACRRASIEGLRMHDLRHTFGSRLIQRGADIETVRSLMGHNSIAITQRYLHSTETLKRKSVDLLSADHEKIS
ncbi:MAG: tyrosine-type recombinase/integrase [Candidatus Aenigmarchaeota archaeon]|nr:tyrosine-type recombinase/integrase [Candidatus Aenigmarchaeota archaeon]